MIVMRDEQSDSNHICVRCQQGGKGLGERLGSNSNPAVDFLHLVDVEWVGRGTVDHGASGDIET